jgi:hypothetical protein
MKMEILRDGIKFRLSEAKLLLPSELHDEWEVRKVLVDRREFVSGSDRILIEASDTDVYVVVKPYDFEGKWLTHKPSELIAMCENVLQRAKDEGVFANFAAAIAIARELEPYLQKLVSQTTADLSSVVQKLQIKVAELERNQKQSK